jgi:hypothetical protein
MINNRWHPPNPAVTARLPGEVLQRALVDLDATARVEPGAFFEHAGCDPVDVRDFGVA